jgi:hypothetical protein
MKRLLPLFVLACIAMFAAPASAKTSLNEAIRLCKTEIDKMTPQPKSARADRDQTRVSDTHLWVAFKYTGADGRLNKLTCMVDREANTAELTIR